MPLTPPLLLGLGTVLMSRGSGGLWTALEGRSKPVRSVAVCVVSTEHKHKLNYHD